MEELSWPAIIRCSRWLNFQISFGLMVAYSPSIESLVILNTLSKDCELLIDLIVHVVLSILLCLLIPWRVVRHHALVKFSFAIWARGSPIRSLVLHHAIQTWFAVCCIAARSLPSIWAVCLLAYPAEVSWYKRAISCEPNIDFQFRSGCFLEFTVLKLHHVLAVNQICQFELA